MEEQNNQNFENQEPQNSSDEIGEITDEKQVSPSLFNNLKDKLFSFIKNTPKTLIIGASVTGAVIIAAIVLIIVFAGQNNDEGSMMYSCTHSSYIAEIYLDATCTEGGSMKYTCSTCGHSYISWDVLPALGHYWESATCTKAERCSRCYTPKDPNSQPLGHTWVEATCTENKKCSVCNQVEYSTVLGHDYSKVNGLCTRCDFGVKFILPTTPETITYRYSSGDTIVQKCKIESIKIERIQESSFSTPYYRLTFVVESTYHKEGSNYSDNARFGWKLYDEDGFVVTSGKGITDGNIKVGEKSKETITFYVGEDRYIQNGKTYRFELLDIVIG